MCWTFVIHYGTIELGLSEVQAQGYNMIAMVIFVTSRFVCTFLLKYVSPGGLLLTLAVGGGALTLGTILLQGMLGLYCLVGISACMSLMFPTIYGIALKGVGEDAKIGAAGLIMAILGGSVMPPVQGAIIDLQTLNLGVMTMPAVRASFVLPLVCFVVIAVYGWRSRSASARAA
jgi:FHS family L-fucose permease-like MFS transporter